MSEMIPLFPLRLVLVPGLELPLHIFEHRYRLLVQHLLSRPEAEREFGIVAMKIGLDSSPDAEEPEETTGLPRIHSIGTTALLQDTTRLPDGRYEIDTIGTRRFRILDLDQTEPYLQARVEFLDEPLVTADDGAAAEEDVIDLSDMTRIVQRRFMAYRELLTDEELDSPLPDDPTALSYFVVAALVHELSVCQRLLEVPDTRSRLVAEAAVLRDEEVLIDQLGSLPDTTLLDTATWSAN